MRNYLSIDIGGTNLKYGLIDHSGNLLFKQQVATPTEKVSFIRKLKEIIAVYQQGIFGVAISVPGKVNSQKGIVYYGGSLPFLDQLNFKELIQNQFDGLSVAVENDGKAGALAELWLGSLQNKPNSAAIILGTGVGGGIIINNQLLPGSHFQAGELSFMINNYQLDGYDKMVGMSCSAVKMIEQIAITLDLPDKKDGLAVFELLSQQNQQAWDIFRTYCRRIAYLILNVQSVVDLSTYAIGGGISGQPLLVKTINEEYDEILSELPLVKETLKRPDIKKAKFENSANLYGALYSLLQEMDN
ncbi:ROK family protein [Liquorilactobacillus mali]|uniref:Transcriptional regulator sugar kinase n=1 Tax=Liquorilactobacillus mali KCTC 3596 = DSM 20444 TaxID=1046596 RepID=J1F5C1_9LACO|nr:ROK family protein [Liquorilactobacillus mali]EJF01557.1 transcriptional regulator/sugar kinase [Liquorilactobacillus mali KCTC 3596 = DSM 20444]KRN10579.1 transcriptional regulator sugar kinase [Liquorilactobacillus mali KCTC 3596 = DSM 20444]MDC7952864.1 ROK family protein [Liquorilactobacillus mali]MDV7758297.1 ROK family protein [Liquorilactobacillus mali]QFQ75388.1 ROK family protein [Liquorilactobacillus mali]